MKKNIIMGLVFSFLILSGCGGAETETLLFDDIKGDYKVEGTVDSAREAVEVLKDKKKIDIVKLEDVEGEVNSNMIINVNHRSDQWDIQIKTRTAIPSYSCEYSMDAQGEPVRGHYVTKACGFDK